MLVKIKGHCRNFNLQLNIYLIPGISPKLFVSSGLFEPQLQFFVILRLLFYSFDPFLRNIALVVVMYYTAVWALVSTLMVYVTSHLHFSDVLLGWLLSGYGVATMFSEGVLVRLIVPYLGEVNSMRLGLLSFAIQTIIIALASTKKWIFISIIFSMLSNLVYPSISSLVSRLVEEEVLGEALGALNGIKAITEGFGPLLFGFLMGFFEDSPLPGAPYLIATVIAAWAFLHCYELPSEPEIVIAKYQAAVQKDESLKSLLYDDYQI